MRMKTVALIAAIALPSVAILSCNSVAREAAPVLLVVNGTQIINQVDKEQTDEISLRISGRWSCHGRANAPCCP